MVRVVDNDDVEQLLDMATVLDVLEEAFLADAAGRAVNIPRSDMILPVSTDEAYVFKVMPGAVEDLGVAALRVQSDRIRWAEDRKVKLGRASGGQYTEYVQLYDTETTEPLLVFPDGVASKLRVGATNALAVRAMAPDDVSTIGLIGSGRQAGGQVWAFDTALDLEEVRVFSPTTAHREAFAAEWAARLDAAVVPTESAPEAVGGADVLACATNAMAPVFDPAWVEPGMHVSAIKIPEVPEGVFDRVDRVAIATHTPVYGPNNYQPRGAGFAEMLDDAWSFDDYDLAAAPDLPTVMADGVDRSPGDTTFFLNNMGFGIQFAALGRAIYDRATEAGVGHEIDTDQFLQSMW